MFDFYGKVLLKRLSEGAATTAVRSSPEKLWCLMREILMGSFVNIYKANERLNRFYRVLSGSTEFCLDLHTS
jgi:hypothetical protein